MRLILELVIVSRRVALVTGYTSFSSRRAS